MIKDALVVYQQFSEAINHIFDGSLKAMYAFGSAVYDDLHVGYSDLDFFAVIACDIMEGHFNDLLEYRKKLKASENKLFGMLEGEFVPESLLAAKNGKAVAYWGTSGERIKSGYGLAGFSMRSLLDDGVLITGEDIRTAISYPTDEEMAGEVRHMINTVRKYAVTTDEDIHSADWLFLLCQSLYWVETGRITCKSKAAKWAESNFNEPWCMELDRALSIRHNPDMAATNENKIWLAGLGPSIQYACNTLEDKLRDRQSL